MTPPKIDLVKLKAVCPEMVGEYKGKLHLDYILEPSEFDAIAATMLKLAEEKREIYDKGYDRGVRGLPRKHGDIAKWKAAQKADEDE